MKAVKQKKISFSELKNWKECPYRHKLVYIDDLPGFQGNEYTAFGTSIHKVCETAVYLKEENLFSIFENEFEKEIKTLEEANISLNHDLLEEMLSQAKNLCRFIIPSLKENFKEYEVVSVEEEILEDITEFNSYEKKYKGYIDLVLKTKDGKYHIIDWKTCSWGWPSQKKTDSFTSYQLTYYKNYFAKKHKIDHKNIETYFILLKRTAKKQNVELLRVSSGPKKVENSLKLLENAIINIENQNYIKNRLSCKYCDFYKTEHCK